MTTPATTIPEESGERIDVVDVASEMEGSFLEYAYSVIYSRALPDARDGLKPVQRRILYQMTEMGLRPDRGHVKSARVVGDVMGKLHPHGDASIYDAMVRLNQPFIMRVPLIDGHGNFGSLDDGPAAPRYTTARRTAAALALSAAPAADGVGVVPTYDNQQMQPFILRVPLIDGHGNFGSRDDGPAAPRYTEARRTAAALALTADLDEDVVDFVPNYDNQLMQPEVLPSAFPNLLVNGATGIA